MVHVKATMKANPKLKFREVLKLAGKTYKKTGTKVDVPKTKKVKKSRKMKPKKSRKMKPKKSRKMKPKKSRKSRRH